MTTPTDILADPDVARFLAALDVFSEGIEQLVAATGELQPKLDQVTDTRAQLRRVLDAWRDGTETREDAAAQIVAIATRALEEKS